jgi:GT2 family glycosyltransferase
MALTYKCLGTVVKETPADLYQLTYVDNGSRQDVLFHLMRNFPQANFIRLPFNHGSVRAINAGLALAMFSPAEFMLLLDNDTEIPAGDSTWLERFISYFDDPQVGAAGAVTNYVSGYQNVDACPDTFMRDWQDKENEQVGGVKGPVELPVLVSFAMMIRKSAFMACGFFDELFDPGNHEDFDYTLRLRQAGYKCVIANSVWIHHRGSQTFKRFDFEQLLEVNGRKLVDKWGVETLAEMGLVTQGVTA